MVDERIKCIAEYYGFYNQRRQCIEELAELTQALCKYDREQSVVKKLELTKHIQEELADVEIMVQQLKYFCGVEEVNAEKERKINRQLIRIELEKALT